MKWAAPQYFWGYLFWAFWVIGLGIVFFYRRRQLKRLCDPEFWPIVLKGWSVSKALGHMILLALIPAFWVLALTRPQWGYEWRVLPREGLDIMIALDISKSMLTTDVAPNRMERAKLAILDLLRHLKGDRIGLIVFAGDAFTVCPLTHDLSGFRLSLKEARPGVMGRGGTNIGAAIKEALNAFAQIPARHKILVLVTDGENLEGSPLEWARKAKEAGLRIDTVGVGTPQGELIRVRDPQTGAMRFLKDETGRPVQSRLNESLLKQIAILTGGVYLPLQGAIGLDYLYERHWAALEKRREEEEKKKRYHERFQWPLAVGCLLAFWEMVWWAQKRRRS